MVKFVEETRNFQKTLRKKGNLKFGYETPVLRRKEGIFFGTGNGITGLEKFLGYSNTPLKIANFPSISLTHDFVRVKAAVCLSKRDSVMVDGKTDASHLSRAIGALEIFREMFQVKDHFAFYIEREKKYESAKGMGESAAFAAATARALCSLMFDSATQGFISSIARLVSGSGSRSAVDGIGFWQSYEGIENRENHAIRIGDHLGKFKIASFPTPNPIKTENVHGIAVKSPFYEQWGTLKFHSIIDLIEHDFDTDMLVASGMRDMLLMHSVLLSMGVSILNEKFFDLLKLAEESNGSFFVTADTGPTPVIFYSDEDMLKRAENIMKREALKGSIVKEQKGHGMDFEKRATENLLKFA